MVRLNQLKDCPITHDDIKNAHPIFGPDLANIRGKTFRRNLEHVKTDYVKIPQDKNVTLVADVMFVNSIPFLVLVSRNINLIAIEHAPTHRSASKLGYLPQRVINVYARTGFRVLNHSHEQ